MPPDPRKPSGTSIGLLAPYSGSNLGDGAIQDALLQGLRSRRPYIRCFHISLNPGNTAFRHQIDAFPITGLELPFYSDRHSLATLGDADAAKVEAVTRQDPEEVAARAGPAGGPEPEGSGVLERLRAIKSVPVIGLIARFLVFRLRDLRALGPELTHWVRALRFIKKLDLVIVAGSGQLNEEWGGPWGHPYSLFKWALLARVTSTPFVVMSVGTDTVRSPLARFFVRQALSTAQYRSFRDQDSRSYFSDWTFTQTDPVVPDLAIGLDVSEYPGPSSDSAQPIVAVSPIAYGHPDFWPTHLPHVYARYVASMVDLLRWLRERGYRVILVRSSSVDRVAVRDILQELEVGERPDAFGAPDHPEVFTYQDLLEAISQTHLVIASRLHGVLLSHILRRPVLAVSWNKKVKAHMTMLGQSKHVVDIHSEDLGNQLREGFSRLESDAHASAQLVGTKVTDLRGVLDRQYDAILAPFVGAKASSTPSPKAPGL